MSTAALCDVWLERQARAHLFEWLHPGSLRSQHPSFLYLQSAGASSCDRGTRRPSEGDIVDPVARC